MDEALTSLESRRQELALATEQARLRRTDAERLSQKLDRLNAVSEKMNARERQRAELQRTIDLEQADLKNTADNISQSIERDLRPRANRLTALQAERQKIDTSRNDLHMVAREINGTRSDLDKIEASVVLLEQESKKDRKSVV